MKSLPKDVSHPTLRRLLDWWEARRGSRAMPSRADVKPAELKDILPDLVLVEVRDNDRRRFHYRLAGTEIDISLGLSIAGRDLDELPISIGGEDVWAQYERTVDSKAPTCCEHELTIAGRAPRLVQYVCALAPLSDDGKRIDTLIGAVVFLARRAA